jgi:hypothetical protein
VSVLLSRHRFYETCKRRLELPGSREHGNKLGFPQRLLVQFAVESPLARRLEGLGIKV